MVTIQKLRHVSQVVAAFALTAGMSWATVARADTSVAWVSPADNSAYPANTAVTITGQAGATGLVGGGLDLVLVLDSSGSMSTTATSGGVTKSRQQWQRDAAIALVNSLPSGSTSVGVVEFDSDANVVRSLIPLTGNLASVVAAINSVDASGGTNIPSGIQVATAQLIGAAHTAGRPQHMVVISDGVTDGNPSVTAAAAIAAGVDSVHSVALPGASLATMQSIASAGNGTYINATSNIQGLIDIFAGTAGSLVGLDYVDVTLADGTVLHDVTTDAFGNFSLNVNVAAGVNTFVANAFGTDGTSASTSLHLVGTTEASVDEPSGLALLGLGILAIGAMRRRKA
jgi:Ca-activated chloride channel homolog